MKESDFEIFRSNRHYIIKRKNGEYSQHSHFDSRQGCEKLLRLITKQTMPNDQYFRTAAKRILSDDEFESLQMHKKQQYYNHNPKNYGGRL